MKPTDHRFRLEYTAYYCMHDGLTAGAQISVVAIGKLFSFCISGCMCNSSHMVVLSLRHQQAAMWAAAYVACCQGFEGQVITS